MVAAGRLGQKNGRGYYRYEPGDRKRYADSEVEMLLARERERAGLESREMDDAEIVERCIYALVNEGARILDDGVAASAADIDTIWLNGYGFPKPRGGPMHYAETVGVAAVLERIREFEQTDSIFWRPADRLVSAANTGRF
jgi:3-hydroxyacyl-CoA dehydrogenase